MKTSELYRFFSVFKKRVPAYALSSAGVSYRNFLLTWLTAFIGSRVIAVVENGAVSDLRTELLRFAVVLLAYAVIDTWAMYLLSVTTQKIENDVRHACLKGILFTSLGQAQAVGKHGEYLSRINRDTSSAVGLLSGGVVMVAMCAISGIGATAVIAKQSVWICVGLYGLGIAGFFLQNRLTALVKTMSKEQSAISSRAMSLYLQIHSRSVDIKAAGKTEYARRLYRTELQTYQNVSKRLAVFSALSNGVSEGISLLGVWGAIAFCLRGYALGRTSLESVVMINQMSSLVITMALSIYGFLSNLRGSMAGVERVLELTELPTEDLSGDKPDLTDASSWLVEARRAECVFENETALTYCCQIPKHRLVALIGESGRGKTTFLRLLLKLRDYSGELRIGNTEVGRCSAKALRNAMAYVPQENPTFGGTVREVLTFGNQSPCSDAELWQALEYVGANRWVGASEDGLDAVVSDGGANLSGGQRQMLAIARAILNRREILILDEAFSGVDDDHVYLILSHLKSLCDDCSVLVVTHDERIRSLCDVCVEI